MHITEQELADYICESIARSENEDMVIPYIYEPTIQVDCYEFISDDITYRDVKMKEGWKIIRGDS